MIKRRFRPSNSNSIVPGLIVPPPIVRKMRDPARAGPVRVPVLVALGWKGTSRTRSPGGRANRAPHPKPTRRRAWHARCRPDRPAEAAIGRAADPRDQATAGGPQRTGAVGGVVDARQHVTRMAVGECEARSRRGRWSRPSRTGAGRGPGSARAPGSSGRPMSWSRNQRSSPHRARTGTACRSRLRSRTGLG